MLLPLCLQDSRHQLRLVSELRPSLQGGCPDVLALFHIQLVHLIELLERMRCFHLGLVKDPHQDRHVLKHGLQLLLLPQHQLLRLLVLEPDPVQQPLQLQVVVFLPRKHPRLPLDVLLQLLVDGDSGHVKLLRQLVVYVLLVVPQHLEPLRPLRPHPRRLLRFSPEPMHKLMEMVERKLLPALGGKDLFETLRHFLAEEREVVSQAVVVGILLLLHVVESGDFSFRVV
mmetsp:Transcript_17862/g.40475  ORF Transcript_17862/g.40475 Transcript_17862/m.40475 type:complete len:228 (+) Transcript_17862:1738-2421(+)